MSDRTKRHSLETAGIDDLMMLDGTPDDSALRSVQLPPPKVERKRTAPSSENRPVRQRRPSSTEHLVVKRPRRQSSTEHRVVATRAESGEHRVVTTRSTTGEHQAVPARAPSKTHNRVFSTPDEQLDPDLQLDTIPEAAVLPTPSPLRRPHEQTEDLKLEPGLDRKQDAQKAAGAPKPDKPSVAGPEKISDTLIGWANEDPTPIATAAHLRQAPPPRRARSPMPPLWVLIFGIVCGLVAVAGIIWSRLQG